MAQVDFYVLGTSGEAARHSFACRLAEKAYRLKNTVHIHTDSQQTARQLDDLLWTFRDGSFVPHDVVDNNNRSVAPVTIGFDASPASQPDLLINLSDGIPEASETVARVAEIVSSDDDSKTKSRQRFTNYRDQGHTLATHKL